MRADDRRLFIVEQEYLKMPEIKILQLEHDDYKITPIGFISHTFKLVIGKKLETSYIEILTFEAKYKEAFN